MTDNRPGFFSKAKPDTSYKSIPKPKSAFTSDNSELLENIHVEEDVLKINNKSLGIPAIVWCEFTALLDATPDNDYTYELLEELIHERISRFNHEELQTYNRILDRKKEQEREKIFKKNKKKKKM